MPYARGRWGPVIAPAGRDSYGTRFLSSERVARTQVWVRGTPSIWCQFLDALRRDTVDEAVGHTGTIQGTIASSANSARRALSSAASEIAGRSTTVRAGTGHPTLAAAHEMEILLVRASVGWRAGEM